jgi:hypothetical protein
MLLFISVEIFIAKKFIATIFLPHFYRPPLWRVSRKYFYDSNDMGWVYTFGGVDDLRSGSFSEAPDAFMAVFL